MLDKNFGRAEIQSHDLMTSTWFDQFMTYYKMVDIKSTTTFPSLMLFIQKMYRCNTTVLLNQISEPNFVR